jgi:hypothetical protein
MLYNCIAKNEVSCIVKGGSEQERVVFCKYSYKCTMPLFSIDKPQSLNGFLLRPASKFAPDEAARYEELERSWHDLIEQFRMTAHAKEAAGIKKVFYEMTWTADDKLEVNDSKVKSVSDWNNSLVVITSHSDQKMTKHWITKANPGTKPPAQLKDEKQTLPNVTIFPPLTSGGPNKTLMAILATSTPVRKQLVGIYKLLQTKDWLVTRLQSPPVTLPDSIVWRPTEERRAALAAVRALAGLTSAGRQVLEGHFQSRTIRRPNVDLPIKFNPNSAQTAALMAFAKILEYNQGPAGSMC